MLRETLALGAVALLLIILRALAWKRRKWFQVRKAHTQGCMPPPSIKSRRWPQISILREALAAIKDERGPQFVIDEMDRISPPCHTVYVPILPLLGHGVLVTRDPENIMAMYKSADFDISTNRRDSFAALLGRGVLTTTGDAWKHSRALVRPQFGKDLIFDLSTKERHVGALMKSIPAGDDQTGWTSKLDLQPLLFRYGLDQSTELLYARSTNSLSAPGGEDIGDDDVGRNFDAAKDWVERHGLLAKFSWLVGTRDFKRHCKVIHNFVDGIVADHLQLRNADNQEKSAGMAFGFDAPRFSLLDELSKCTNDPLELRNETLNLLSASKGTTACLPSWAVYHLARNPVVYRRLRSAVLDCVEDGMPSLEQLSRCEYLQWVVNETLRIAAVVPMNDRVAVRDGMMPRGGGPGGSAPVFVPEGTQVMIPIYAVQHRQDLWGPDADLFRPERWDGRKIGLEFLPFSSGRRKCLGREYQSCHL